MAVTTANGTSGPFSWSVVYDSVAHTVTMNASGPGRMTVVLRQDDDRMAAGQWTQPGDSGNPIPVPAGLDVAVIVPLTVGVEKVINNVRLKPIPDSVKGGPSRFDIVNAEWQST